MSGMDRRRFFKVTAITGTSAALAGCGNPEHQLMRFVPEEEITPGIAVWKPSVCPLCSAGCGVVARVMDGDAEVFRNGQPGVTRMGLAAQAGGRPRASGQPGTAVRPRPGGAAGDLPPRSDRDAAARTGERGSGSFQEVSWDEALADLAGRLDALVEQGQAGAIAFLGRPRRGRRHGARHRVPAPPRRAAAGRVRALRRRRVPPRQRRQLRPLSAAHARPGAHPLPPRLRRRLSRHVELAGGPERRLRPDAPGAAGRAGEVRAGRTAGLADRRQCRRVGGRASRHRGRRGAWPGPRDHARRAGRRVRRGPRRRPRRRVGWRTRRRSRRPRWRSAPVWRRRESSGWPRSSRRIVRRWR